jgi:hypothetical protein
VVAPVTASAAGGGETLKKRVRDLERALGRKTYEVPRQPPPPQTPRPSARRHAVGRRAGADPRCA